MVRSTKKAQVKALETLLFAMGSMASAQSIVASVASELEDCHGTQERLDDVLHALECAVTYVKAAKANIRGEDV